MTKKSFVMWAGKTWFKCAKKKLKDGIAGGWCYTGTYFFSQVTNPYWHKRNTDLDGNDIVKVRVTIEEVSK